MDQSPDEVSAVAGYKKTSLEERAEVFNFGAPVTGATAIKDAIAVCFGDGSVRFFRPEEAYTEVQAHDGVVLCLAADIDHLLTGGDDGRFLRTGPDCSIVELSNFDKDIGFYNKPIDPAVKPTTRKKENSSKSLGKELTIRFI